MHAPHNDEIWSIGKKLAFRFCAVYFILYLLSLLLGVLFIPLVAIAAHLLHIPPAAVHPLHNGSGDTLYHYMLLLCIAVVTPVIVAIWTFHGRGRANYVVFAYWLQVVLRYMLMFYLLIYGFGKVFMTQFRYPSMMQLVAPYGYSSPMGVAWRFMGFSYGYNVFAGMAEVVGGLLLFFRRTRTFGALFAVAVLANVVAMNFCFDIPVKIFSAHLLLMALVIASADTRRLNAFFFLNSFVLARTEHPLLNKELNTLRIIAKAIIGALIIAGAAFMYAGFIKAGAKAVSPLYGVYDVVQVIRNGQSTPLIATDTLQWRQVIIERNGYGVLRTMDDRQRSYSVHADSLHTFTIMDNRTNTGGDLTYSFIDSTHVQLSGTFLDDSLMITLQKKDLKDFLLINRGFHWVNEQPYNR